MNQITHTTGHHNNTSSVFKRQAQAAHWSRQRTGQVAKGPCYVRWGVQGRAHKTKLAKCFRHMGLSTFFLCLLVPENTESSAVLKVGAVRLYS